MSPKNRRTLLHVTVVLLIIVPLPLFKYLYDPAVRFAVDTSIIAMYDAQSDTGKIAFENSRDTGTVIFFSYDREQSAKDSVEAERRKKLVSFNFGGEAQNGPSHVKVIRQGGRYQVFIPVQKAVENDQEALFLMTDLANNLSEKVFDNSCVDINLSDAFFNSFKTVSSQGKQD